MSSKRRGAATVSWDCPKCRRYIVKPVTGPTDLTCPHCGRKGGPAEKGSKIFEVCPVCTCRQFYVQKDFNRGLGCLVMLIGILLVPKTYGLSLPVFAGIDWLLFRKVSTMVVCYRCAAEFRGFGAPSRFKPFMHHIGMKYDKYR